MKTHFAAWIFLVVVLLAACSAPVAAPAASPTPRPQPTANGPVDDQGAVLTWSRTGGFAGFCDQLVIYADGQALASTCATQTAPTSFVLNEEQLARLNDWRARFNDAAIDQSDPANAADAMLVKLTLRGDGEQTPSDMDQAALVSFAQAVFASATQ